MEKHIGNLIIREGDKTDYSQLKEVTGYLSINSDAKLDNLTSVGGSLSIYSDAKLDNLTSVGGYLSIYSDAKLDAPFLKGLKYKSVDGYLFIIESERKKGDITILKGYNAKGVKDNAIVKEPCFVAEKGEYQAHGQDLKQAIKDLDFKILSDKIKKEPISMEDYITPEKYRMITGACEFGVNSWLKENGITQKRIKVKNILPILEKTNAYRHDILKQLIK